MSKQYFVLVNKKTKDPIERDGEVIKYYGIGAAKAAVTRMCNKSGIMPISNDYPLYVYTIVDRDHFVKTYNSGVMV